MLVNLKHGLHFIVVLSMCIFIKKIHMNESRCFTMIIETKYKIKNGLQMEPLSPIPHAMSLPSVKNSLIF